jgi:hypothetical protein
VKAAPNAIVWARSDEVRHPMRARRSAGAAQQKGKMQTAASDTVAARDVVEETRLGRGLSIQTSKRRISEDAD